MSSSPERPRRSRLRLTLLGAVLLLAPVPVACQFTGPGFEQVPQEIREQVARSEARGGPYADPPLEQYPSALVDSSDFVELVERVEELEDLEPRLVAVESGTSDARDAAASEGALSRDRDEALAETVRVEAAVARQGRERLAEEVDELGNELEIRTDAAASEVDQLEGEIATSLAQEDAQDARLTDLEASVEAAEALDADFRRRVEELESRAADPDLTARVEAVELALSERPASITDDTPGPDSGAPDEQLAAAPNDSAQDSMLTSATGSALAFSIQDAGLLIVVLVVIALLVLGVMRMRVERERDRHSTRVFDRIEDAVRALDEHLARQAVREEQREAAAAQVAAEPEPEPVIVVEEPAEEESAAPVATPEGDATQSESRWERFVERVEGQREEPERVVIERPQPAPGTRQRRVLDRGFLERYRGRGTDGRNAGGGRA